MKIYNLMVRFQLCWSFGECGVHLHCHGSQVYCGSEWFAPDRVLSVGRIKLNNIFMLNRTARNRTVLILTVCKKKTIFFTKLNRLKFNSVLNDVKGLIRCKTKQTNKRLLNPQIKKTIYLFILSL